MKRLPVADGVTASIPATRSSAATARRRDTDTATGRHTLDACFLGPYGENDALLEKLVVEFLRDHVYWRRNFHPEDPPAIPTRAVQHPDYQAFEASLRRELHDARRRFESRLLTGT